MLLVSLGAVLLADAACSGMKDPDVPYNREEKKEAAGVALACFFFAVAIALIVGFIAMMDARREYVATHEPDCSSKVVLSASRFLPFANVTLLVLAGIYVTSALSTCGTNRGNCDLFYTGERNGVEEKECTGPLTSSLIFFYLIALLGACATSCCCLGDVCCDCGHQWEPQRKHLQQQQRSASREPPVALAEV